MIGEIDFGQYLAFALEIYIGQGSFGAARDKTFSFAPAWAAIA
jgi:hypothetical protein